MRVHPDVFEVRLHRSDYDRRITVEVRSRMYDVRLAYSIREAWGDPRPLAEYIERLIGGTLSVWREAHVSPASGREMAQALQPHWEREIHGYMERLEYEGRMHRRGPADRYWYSNPGEAGTWADTPPSEDPKAKEKARQLLMRNLDDGQQKSFKKDGSFRVTAKDGKVYTISTARSFNVKAEDGTKYCGQLADTPIEDQMLAQKLLLQHDPEKFFKKANVSPASGSMTATEVNMREEATRLALRVPSGYLR
jgi:hypothetical protein